MRSETFLVYSLTCISCLNFAQASFFSWVPNLSIECCNTTDSSDTHRPFLCRICQEDKVAEQNTTEDTSPSDLPVVENEYEISSLNYRKDWPWATSLNEFSGPTCIRVSQCLLKDGDSHKEQEEPLSTSEYTSRGYTGSFFTDAHELIAEVQTEDGIMDYFGHEKRNEEPEPVVDKNCSPRSNIVLKTNKQRRGDFFDAMRDFVHTYMRSPISIRKIVCMPNDIDFQDGR